MKVNDLVVATHYSDGDVLDPWYVGTVKEIHDYGFTKVIYLNEDYHSYRKAKKIPCELSSKLILELKKEEMNKEMYGGGDSVWKVLKRLKSAEREK